VASLIIRTGTKAKFTRPGTPLLMPMSDHGPGVVPLIYAALPNCFEPFSGLVATSPAGMGFAASQDT
jgi:hypothetical protein